MRPGGSLSRRSSLQAPVASFTHLVVKLVSAAPCSFFALASAPHLAFASFSHFVRKLVCAAPCSFLASDCALQVSAAAPPAIRQVAATMSNVGTLLVILVLRGWLDARDAP